MCDRVIELSNENNIIMVFNPTFKPWYLKTLKRIRIFNIFLKINYLIINK